MRLNKFIASQTGLSRRAADVAISAGRIRVNGQPAPLGVNLQPSDVVELDGTVIAATAQQTTVMLNKPPGYVCSRDGQGSQTVYDLLPPTLHHLKPVGRLDKDSSGLLLLTNDGELANQLTHPRYGKTKHYRVVLNKQLAPEHQRLIHEQGVHLEDGVSKLTLTGAGTDGRTWDVTMHEGRNRQIRRTFAALGYQVTKLHRDRFGDFRLGTLAEGSWKYL